ncbi:MAG: glycosyltransferase family 4 protein [Candidatus Dormibacteraceae bacterium]
MRRGPAGAVICVLSFEGPDQYSQAGGLGSRVSGLVRALAGQGFETHLFFVGDPGLPALEQAAGVWYHRWSQWLSGLHPRGVYDGEAAKVEDWNRSLPPWLEANLIAPAVQDQRPVIVLAEDWQTAMVVRLLSDRLLRSGLRPRTVILWNANNLYGFEQIEVQALDRAATLTTVSRYMKHRMWQWSVNPMVIPNGIPESARLPVSGRDARLIRRAAGADLCCFKIGRFDPDKRWLMAVTAIAHLKRQGRSVKLLIRGSRDGHGRQVLAHARAQGLSVAEARSPQTVTELIGVLKAHPEVDLINLSTFLPEAILAPIYRSVDAVLANSGHEPFGLVGLEVMAAGGVAVTGSTGEDYAQPYRNAIVLETEDPRELSGSLGRLLEQPQWGQSLRRRGRETALDYTWERVLEQLFDRIDLISERSWYANGAGA